MDNNYNPDGKGLRIVDNETQTSIYEGYWKNGLLNGLGRHIGFAKKENELKFQLGVYVNG